MRQDVGEDLYKVWRLAQELSQVVYEYLPLGKVSKAVCGCSEKVTRGPLWPGFRFEGPAFTCWFSGTEGGAERSSFRDE